MIRIIRNTILGTTAILLLCSSPASAQFGLGALKEAVGGQKGNNQAAGAAQNAAASAAMDPDLNEGTIEGYLEMRAFAEGLYHQLEGSGDSRRASDFKRRVDAAFERTSKEDMQRAYNMNVSAKSEVKYVIEDRFRIYTGLYDNPVVQALVNRVGQSIVSSKTSHLYTFKLVADPVPWADSLSTGTVWVSTGMVALMKNKAQLAYVLAHEAAHISLDHHRQRLLLQHAQEEYNRQLTENGENRQKRWSWIGGAIGVAGGAFLGAKTDNMAAGLTLGGLGGLLAGNLLAGATNPDTLQNVEWNRFEEDDADRLAFDWLLDGNIDVNQVPAVYIALRDMGERDPRVKLGFLGKTDRVRDRMATVQTRLQFEQSQPDWSKRKLATSDSDFDLLLAEVQRDNGVFAFHYDMLETARENLRGAVAVKTEDPTALYFYARVLSQTARTDPERAEADKYFAKAAAVDYRNQNFGAYLHRAIEKLTATNATATDKAQATEFLKQYAIGYHLSAAEEEKSKGLLAPPHLESVYDYLARSGDVKWKLDEATIKRARTALEAGISLADYKEPDAPKGPNAVQQIQSTITPAAAPEPPSVARPPAAPAGGRGTPTPVKGK